MNDPKGKSTKKQYHKNVVESLKNLGSSSMGSMAKDVLRPNEVMSQLFGTPDKKKYSGDINPGESIEFSDVFTGKREKAEKLQKQINLERNLRNEEKVLIEKKSNQLKLQIQALMQEVGKLSQSTGNLSQEVKIASLQAPIEPGIYHLVFFEKLLEFVKSFKKKVEDASVWLHASNARAAKKNYWSSYKKHGSKFLLSADHYLTRSAG